LKTYTITHVKNTLKGFRSVRNVFGAWETIHVDQFKIEENKSKGESFGTITVDAPSGFHWNICGDENTGRCHTLWVATDCDRSESIHRLIKKIGEHRLEPCGGDCVCGNSHARDEEKRVKSFIDTEWYRYRNGQHYRETEERVDALETENRRAIDALSELRITLLKSPGLTQFERDLIQSQFSEIHNTMVHTINRTCQIVQTVKHASAMRMVEHAARRRSQDEAVTVKGCDPRSEIRQTPDD
jgi:hypothetical protein